MHASTFIPSFEEFLEYLTKIDVKKYDGHWKPYWKLCAPCLVKYQAIGHEETKEKDIPFILKESHLEHRSEAQVRIFECSWFS